MAETPWNITTTVQAMCKQQQQNKNSNGGGCVSSLRDIPRSQLRIKESFGSGCLGEVIESKQTNSFSQIYRTSSFTGDSKLIKKDNMQFIAHGCFKILKDLGLL